MYIGLLEPSISYTTKNIFYISSDSILLEAYDSREEREVPVKLGNTTCMSSQLEVTWIVHFLGKHVIFLGYGIGWNSSLETLLHLLRYRSVIPYISLAISSEYFMEFP